MANTKTNTKSNDDSKRIKELEKTVSDLNNMIALLMKQTANNNVFSGDRDILFISLCNHILNLSTEPNGGGEIYTFTEFGEEQSIPYSDAKRIIKSNKSFIQGGKCYIADDELIKSEHLVNDYKKPMLAFLDIYNVCMNADVDDTDNKNRGGIVFIIKEDLTQ